MKAGLVRAQFVRFEVVLVGLFARHNMIDVDERRHHEGRQKHDDGCRVMHDGVDDSAHGGLHIQNWQRPTAELRRNSYIII